MFAMSFLRVCTLLLLPALCLFFSSLPAQAFSVKQASEKFDEAAKAKSFLKFTIPTKKMGLFRSEVTGYATKFSATAKIDKGSATDISIELPVRGLDTDLYARNDQMWNACLAQKEHPVLKLTFPSLKFEEGKEVKAAGTLSVRGKQKPFEAAFTLEKKDKRWVAFGKATTSFEALEIPDPSIGVASVDGPIQMEFFLEDAGP